jgi:SWIM zinc finger
MIASTPSTPSRKRKVAQRDTEVIDLTVSPVAAPKKTPSKRRKPSVVEEHETPESSPEKRAKRLRDRPPQNVLVKKQRVMTQRMFLVERSGRKNGELKEEFSVLGSTGNVYVVNVSMIPTYVPLLFPVICLLSLKYSSVGIWYLPWFWPWFSKNSVRDVRWSDIDRRCTCPDFVKHQVHCKHILFIFLKALKLPDPLWFQAAFLTSVPSYPLLSPPNHSRNLLPIPQIHRQRLLSLFQGHCWRPSFTSSKIVDTVIYISQELSLTLLSHPWSHWQQELEEIFGKIEDSRHAVSDKVRNHFKALKSGIPIPDEKDDHGRKPLEGDWYYSPSPLCNLSFDILDV